jgi:hypothetical protein
VNDANGKMMKWTQEEDAKNLTEAVKKHAYHWTTVAAMVWRRRLA